MSCGTLKDIQFETTSAQILSIECMTRIAVQWELKETRQNTSVLRFYVDRAEVPTKWTTISPALPSTQREFVDYTGKLKSLDKTYYYRVRAVEVQSGMEVQTFTAESVTTEARPDLTALYVIEEHLYKHRYVSGLPSLIYKKMKEGTKCTDCWDKVFKRVTKSNCQTCNGTGFSGGGYYPPIESWIDYQPDPKVVSIAEWGEREISQTDIEFTNYPLLSPGDLVLELQPHKFWRVSNVRPVQKNRAVMRQVARLDAVNRSDIEYKLEVDENVRSRMVAELEERLDEPEF